jgi:6-phosphogluconolactonase
LHVFYTSVLSNHLKLLEQVMFIVLGASKAEVLQRVFERPALPGALPAQMVRPNEGDLSWFVDKDAASKLAIASWSDPKKFPFFDWSSLNQSKTSIGKATSS